ncbi:MAG: hypothetical protein JSV80_11615, partial [Acidobacteriota bacterium]
MLVRRFASFAIAVSVSLAGALAVDVPPQGSLDDKVVRPSYLLDALVAADARQAPSAAFERFVASEGGSWNGRLEASSGRVGLIWGSGIPLVPGSGNGLEGGEAAVDLALLEQRVRALIGRHPDLLAPGSGELELSRARSTVLDGGRVAFVDFDWSVGGRKVRGARVFARINSGNVIQLGTRLLGGNLQPFDPVLTADEAIARMFEHIGGRSEADRPFGEPELFYEPRETASTIEYRLVWEVAFHRVGEPQTWTARVDAVGGEVLAFFDANRYGQVTGGIFPRTVVDEEIVVGMPEVAVDGAGVTDRNGLFSYAGGRVATGLDGAHFSTNCEDGCTDPPQANVETDLGLGWLRLGTGGTDGTGNGLSTRAERHTFFHLNAIRSLAKKWLDVPWLDSTVRANVNIADTCNAFWNGSVNFYRSGGGCNNTGEIADVIYHEWGHGIDGNTLGGDSATGEGTGDVASFSLTHGSVIGPHFRTSGGGVRDVNKDTTSKGLITRSNASSKCPSAGLGCGGPLGLECHCEGEIYGQTGWDLAQALVAK